MIHLANKHLDRRDIDKLLTTDHPMIRCFSLVPLFATDSSFSFKLVIEPKAGVKYYQQRDRYGKRISPLLRTLTGNETIGEGHRCLYVIKGEIFAENQTFFPNQEFNDLGIGSALYESQERLYDALGVKRVELYAVSVGVYVWARQGFDFTYSSTLCQVKEEFTNFLKKQKFPIPEKISRSWEVASHQRDIVIEDYPLGKYWMLRHAPTWHGYKNMEEPLFREVAEQSRQEMRSKRRERIIG